MASVQPPANRKAFRVAIVCALPQEADAVALLFDQFWEDPYGRADGDPNSYITGRIGEHHVVLLVLPSIGTNSAAAATASLRSSYTGLKLAILVGICGGIPRIDDFDAFLGDVVVSKTIIQYDYGRQYPGYFAIKDKVEDSLGRADNNVRALLNMFETEHMRERLQNEALTHLKLLQEAAKGKRRRANYQYPGIKEDQLFPPEYTHRHKEGCNVCSDNPDGHCKAASQALCDETGCDATKLVMRERSAKLVQGADFSPEILIGRIGSGNTVMKSGKDRDRIAAEYDLIAFEMEGAGAWDEAPCIVVKGICNYADSHNNKAWQDFAAATAASVTKAMLRRYAVSDGDRFLTQKHNESHGENRSIAGNRAMLQGDAAPFEENRLGLPSPKLTDPNPAELWGKAAEIGERKWRRYMYRPKQTDCCFNCGSEGHWEKYCLNVCGKCFYDTYTASGCYHPVRCFKCDEQGHMREDCSK